MKTDVTKMVNENIFAWPDPLGMFTSMGKLCIRVWSDAGDPPAKPRVHRTMFESLMMNHFDMAPLRHKVVTSDHALVIAQEVTRLLQFVNIQVNAVEVTVNGEGSIHYPEWP